MSPSIIILSTLSSDWSLLTQDWALIGPCRPLYQWAWSNEAAPLGTEGGGRESRRGVDMRGEIFTGEICGQAGQRIGDKAGRFWNTKIFQWMGWEASTTQATGPYLNYSIANQRYFTDSFCSKRLVKFFNEGVSQWLLFLFCTDISDLRIVIIGFVCSANSGSDEYIPAPTTVCVILLEFSAPLPLSPPL